MNDIIRLVLTLIGLAFITISCQPESVSTEFLEIDEKGVAMYRVTNPTNKDISGISFEFTYTNIDGKIINVDTVSYKTAERSSSEVWLEAGALTYVTQKVPHLTNTASAKVISITDYVDSEASEAGKEFPDRQGYVLKVGEGEEACCDVLIKASPKSGTQGGVVILQPMPPDFSTGLHFHKEADEFFYVISGTGTATIAGQEYEIGPGHVIFVPAGEDHKLVTHSEKMEILEFLDKPGLDEEFRAAIEEPLTLEKLNEVANRYGTVYKTLE